MATITPSAALVPVAPVFTNTERLALARFLAVYGSRPSSRTRPCKPVAGQNASDFSNGAAGV